MNYDELCVAIARYATEFREDNSQKHQGSMKWDEENKYIMDKLRVNDGIKFESVTDVKVLRCEANVHSEGKYL